MPIERTIPAEKLASQIRGYAMLFGGAREAASPQGGSSINAAGLKIPGVAKGIELPKDEYIPSFPRITQLPPPVQEEPARDEEDVPTADETGAAEAEAETEAEEEAQNEKEGEDGELTPEEQQTVAELKVTDQKVRAHEQAHISVGGSYILGGAVFEYEKGPDQKRYAVGGEVGIDSSPVRDNPEATIAKMQVVRAAALAPADPSAQDRAVASAASREEGQARVELREQKTAEAEESAENRAHGRGNNKNGAARIMADAVTAYTKPFAPQASQTVINFAA